MISLKMNLTEKLSSAWRMEPTLEAQLIATAVWAVVLLVFMKLVCDKVVLPRLKASVMRDQFVYIGRKMLKVFGVEKSTDEVFLNFQSAMIAAWLQHVFSALLCVPSLCGWFSPSVRTAMALHGAVSELGTELGTTVAFVYEAFYGTLERKEMARSPKFLTFTIIHHTLQFVCVLPLNIHMRDEPLYHEMVFNLEFAGGFLSLMCFYVISLDQNIPANLTIDAAIKWIYPFAWSYLRIWRFGICAHGILAKIALDESLGAGFWWSAAIGVALMSFFNFMTAVDSFKKLYRVVFKERKIDPVLNEINRKARERQAEEAKLAKEKESAANWKLYLKGKMKRRTSSLYQTYVDFALHNGKMATKLV